MAKKTTPKRVAMKTAADLRDWLWEILRGYAGADWSVQVAEERQLEVNNRRKSESIKFNFFVMSYGNGVHFGESAPSVVELALKFQNKTWNELQKAMAPIEPPRKPQVCIESHQPRLTHKQPALPFHPAERT